jgi:hypothetical protein
MKQDGSVDWTDLVQEGYKRPVSQEGLCFTELSSIIMDQWKGYVWQHISSYVLYKQRQMITKNFQFSL